MTQTLFCMDEIRPRENFLLIRFPLFFSHDHSHASCPIIQSIGDKDLFFSRAFAHDVHPYMVLCQLRRRTQRALGFFICPYVHSCTFGPNTAMKTRDLPFDLSLWQRAMLTRFRKTFVHYVVDLKIFLGSKGCRTNSSREKPQILCDISGQLGSRKKERPD